MRSLKRRPKILYLDIETAPNLGYVWGIWEQNVIEIRNHWYMLSFSVKWEGEKVKTHALPDYKNWKKNREDDSALLEECRDYLHKADVVIAHNGDRFDFRKINARCVVHMIRPPSPYKTIDTLKMARRFFAFDSNKLDDLGHTLGVGRKLPHTGKHLWFGCMSGDAESWKTMRKYNAMDVELLERVYLRLRPWAENHPKMNFVTRDVDECPVCNSSNTSKNGTAVAMSGSMQRRQRHICNDCGHWFRGEIIKNN